MRCVLLSSMLFNLPFGPWEGGSWWQKSCGAAEAYVARATFAFPVFSALYDSICNDQKIKPTGSPEHRQLVFYQMMIGDCFKNKGNTVALKRWLSLVDVMAYFDSNWHTRLLSLIMFGMSSGIHHDCTEVLLWKIAGDVAATPMAADDSDDEAER